MGAATVAAAGPLRWDGRPLPFVIQDLLDHPFYWWPRTLLSYPIEFGPAGAVALDRLVLTNQTTGERLPIQFSGVTQERATLHFFSDLPSGGRREFVLSQGDAAGVVAPLVKEVREGNAIVLDSGAMRVRIPASQRVRGGGDAPGPVMQTSRDGARWAGHSTLTLSDGKIVRIEAKRVANGPLFVAYENTYESEGGSRYVARVQCNAGFDFVRLQEDMRGLKPGVRGTFTSTWSGFEVTHRQAPNHPVPLVPKIGNYDEYPWERIDERWRGRDITLGSSKPIYFEFPPQGELPFCLGIFQSWPAYHVATNANFRAQKTGDALGVFIDKVAEWQDNEYAYEVESAALQVRFYYGSEDRMLRWRWPLLAGARRSTCIAFYDHEKDKAAMREFERADAGVLHKGFSYQVGRAFTSHTRFLQNRYGTIDLNEVKAWVLEYPKDGRQPAPMLTAGMVKDPAELERRILASGYANTLPIFGPRENGGSGPVPGRNIVNFSPVPSRQLLAAWVGGYNSSRAAMNDRQRTRINAMLLFLAYVHMGDDYMPVRPMLGGHPNFLADVKSALAVMPFLFPEHPMAAAWADHWEKCMELNARFNTRPAVRSWDAQGGRWTENLGTYVWAFLRPALRCAFLLRQYDGVERFVSPQIAELAGWLVNALSAPFEGETAEGYRALKQFDGGREWCVVAPGQGPRRVYPPQGAHAERRMPPASLWHLGYGLRRYAPLAAEYAMWASRPSNQETETALNAPKTWATMYDVAADNTGTNPHLRSSKFTGYGVVLRAAVDTPDEVSVHLQQIDEGPNYRWGRTGEGGCGVLYFFAAGKAYSHNGPEDTGDRVSQDTDFCTNFGVLKDGRFRGIGMNVLSPPLRDLGSAGQFAEIVPRTENAYAAPEYVSRSVMLAGHEYFVLYDAVLDSTVRTRLSWYVRRGEELPSIQRVRGGGAARTVLQNDLTHGVWLDGAGDSMAIVSHRKDVKAEAAAFGARVHFAGGEDLVFRSPSPVTYAEGGFAFEGTAGLIRKFGAGKGIGFALFQGTRIAVPGLLFETTGDLGIGGATTAASSSIRGVFTAPQRSSLRITLSGANLTFYVDGERRGSGGAFVVDLDAGRHEWELTDKLPAPIAPRVLRTENVAGGARVFLTPVASATRYRVELSTDAGASWTAGPASDGPVLDVSGLANGRKVHVRGVAANSEHESAPGHEYPLYVTDQAPEPPDGLHVDLADGAVTWGEVLGVREYRLYGRPKSNNGGEFQLLYRGLERRYVGRRSSDIVEYVVTASNGNGEGSRSRAADTDPNSWRNWDPKPGERFRRVYSSDPVYPRPSGVTMSRYYPD